MTKRPLQPKETALSAIQRGDLIPLAALSRAWEGAETVKEGEWKSMMKDDAFWNSLKTPEEAGIAKIRSTPPAPSSKLLLRKKREVGDRKRWVVTKKTRPDLYP